MSLELFGSNWPFKAIAGPRTEEEAFAAVAVVGTGKPMAYSSGPPCAVAMAARFQSLSPEAR